MCPVPVDKKCRTCKKNLFLDPELTAHTRSICVPFCVSDDQQTMSQPHRLFHRRIALLPGRMCPFGILHILVMNIKDKNAYDYQRHNMKKDGLSLGSFLALATFVGLLVSNIGTTYLQKQAFGSSDFNAFAKHQSTPFPGMNFSKPKDVWSKDGILRTTLVAAYHMGKVDGQPVTAMLYNGSLPGPTLHVYPGDRIELNLINNLNETTNLHFHGFHVSPANNSDNIFLEVAPGKTQHYTVDIPKDHPLGTDWYHSHLHELSYGQVAAGLSGLIIVEGLQKLLPKPLQDITTQTFAMRDFPYDQLYVTTNNIEHDLLPLSNTDTGHECLDRNMVQMEETI
jgi:FtsP/CotA-like multicopper oxidase with cupredoxin domain